MKIVKILFLLSLSLILFSCDNDDKIITLKVASETIDRPIVPSKELAKHIILTDVKSGDTFYLPLTRIENFEYEEGYNYVISVKTTYSKVQYFDDNNTDYLLIKIISKEKPF